jgi:hypothetical protein
MPETKTTSAELLCLNHLREAWNLFLKLPREHPQEVDEFLGAINAAQNVLAVRVARRADPDVWITVAKEPEEAPWEGDRTLCRNCSEELFIGHGPLCATCSGLQSKALRFSAKADEAGLVPVLKELGERRAAGLAAWANRKDQS